MRNYMILFLSLVIASTITINSGAQNLPTAEVKELGSFQKQDLDNGGGSLECGPNVIYGQALSVSPLIVGPSLLLPGNNGYMLVDNFINIGSAVSGITFFGTFQSEGFCLPAQPLLFKIGFYETGDLNNPIYQYDLSLTGELIDLGGIPIFRFEGTFPEPANLPEAGLVSIQHIVDPFQPPCFFYWLGSLEGDMSSFILVIENGEIVNGNSIPYDWSFCLYEARVIPIANWAVMVGFILILVTLFIRLRKHY